MISIHFTDFWEGHDPKNNILTNILQDIYNDKIIFAPTPKDADINFVTIYGNKHQQILRDFDNTILWLGENQRPNQYKCKFSISFDFHSFNNTNFRLPLWYSEIDWYGTGLGITDVETARRLLCDGFPITPEEFTDRKFCITIFNNPEGTRIEMYKRLCDIEKVDGYGRPFGNWFPTYENYRDKIKKLAHYKFNLCPENSYYPGYYTEKCIHSKLAGCVPIYMADSHVKSDFRASSFLNIYDYKNLDALIEDINDLKDGDGWKIASEPLLNKMPSLEGIKQFLLYATSQILRAVA